MFKEFKFRPRNPRHFVALCFIQLKKEPEMARRNLYMKKVLEVNREALFVCAYGYFWVNKTQNIEGIFFRTQEEALKAQKAGW